MYRRGPPKSTPASVQCQKCLKRDMFTPDSPPHIVELSLTSSARHYSYECKASAQERPYIARPSRTQQMLNPKLAPKLSEGVPDYLQKKKGVADEQLARREAERARKRELERDEDDPLDNDGPSKRRRSASFDSVSSISSRGSPARARNFLESKSQALPSRGHSTSHGSRSPERRSSPGRSYDSASEYGDRQVSLSPPRRQKQDTPPKHLGRGRRVDDDEPVYSRYQTRDNSPVHESLRRRRRRYSSSASRSPPPASRQRFRSRSPDRFERRGRSPARNRNIQSPRGMPPPKPDRQSQRDRSLSPFSKRLAMTRTMNKGH